MSSPALIKKDDAKRLFAAASEMGFDRCEIVVGSCRMIFTKDQTSPEKPEDDGYLE